MRRSVCLATIDVTLFREYFFDCSIIEIEGRAFDVREYFLEDIIQLLNFQINPLNSSQRKHNASRNRAMNDELDEEVGYEDSQGEENEVRSFILVIRSIHFVSQDINHNAICGKDYSRQTAAVMSQLSEKILSFELIEVRSSEPSFPRDIFLLFSV